MAGADSAAAGDRLPPGEILGLKWDKVDSLNRQITIDCTLLYASDRGVYEGHPKPKVPFRHQASGTDGGAAGKLPLLAGTAETPPGRGMDPIPFVFTGEKGGPMNPSQLGNWLDRFARRHNLPHLNPHAFRHTMTSVLFSTVWTASVSAAAWDTPASPPLPISIAM